MALASQHESTIDTANLERSSYSMASNCKAVRIADLIYLAETRDFQRCLEGLRNAYMNLGLSFDDTLSVIKKIVEKVREDVKDCLSSIAHDPIVCSGCYSFMFEAVTFPCGHTFCGNCSKAACLLCSERFQCNERQKNIVIALVVKHFWSNECQGIVLRNAGSDKLKHKLYREAVDLYDQSLTKYPGDHIALANRAHALLCLGRPAEALADADAAISKCPLWARGHARRSSALQALGRTEEACAALLLCTAICEDQASLQYTEDLANMVHRLLVGESKRNKSRRQTSLLHESSSTATSSSEHLPRDGFPFASGFASSSSTSAMDTSDPLGHHTSDPLSRPASGSGHFKKIWKELSLRTSDQPPRPHFLRNVLARYTTDIEAIRENCHASHTKLPVNHDLKPDDLECSLCMRLLWQPVSTPCGHTFCLSCLNRSLDHRPSCPLCKASLVKILADRRFLQCDFVDAITRRVFPEEFAIREKQMQTELDTLSEAGRDPNCPIPIFVATVALPFVPCPLHVFEPRYKLMIRRCMESGTREFGMCGPVDNFGYYDYGTTLEIRDIRYLPDGRSVLNTVGKRRFKVVQRSERDGYNVATVQFVEDDTSLPMDETKKLHDQVRRNVETWLGRMPAAARRQIYDCYGEMPAVELNYWTKPHGPDWLWWLASVLPIHHLTKYSLLGMVQLRQRILLLQQNLLRFLKDTWRMEVPKP